MSEATRHLHGQAIEGQRKYAYFLLAVAASAIAFAVSRTESAVMTYSQAPLAIAVLCWALSFFFGCQHLAYVTATLKANAAMLTIQAGEHPDYPPHPEMVDIARTTTGENAEGANRNAKRQFRFLVSGALFYVAWHVVEMALRAP